MKNGAPQNQRLYAARPKKPQADAKKPTQDRGAAAWRRTHCVEGESPGDARMAQTESAQENAARAVAALTRTVVYKKITTLERGDLNKLEVDRGRATPRAGNLGQKAVSVKGVAPGVAEVMRKTADEKCVIPGAADLGRTVLYEKSAIPGAADLGRTVLYEKSAIPGAADLGRTVLYEKSAIPGAADLGRTVLYEKSAIPGAADLTKTTACEELGGQPEAVAGETRAAVHKNAGRRIKDRNRNARPIANAFPVATCVTRVVRFADVPAEEIPIYNFRLQKRVPRRLPRPVPS